MEVAKQFLIASAGASKSKTESTPDEKKRKWEARKTELMTDILEILLKEMTTQPQPPDSETESEGEPELPAKKPKKSKKAAAAKPKKKSSHLASSGRSAKKRKSVKPAISDEDSATDSEASEIEQERVPQLW